MGRRARGDTETRKERMIELLLAGCSVGECATELGVHRQTIWEWRQLPEVDEQIRTRADQVRDALHGRLVERSLKAADVLDEIMRDKGAPPMARVHAVRLHFELLGRHKGSPVQPSVQEPVLETEDDAVKLLQEYPEDLLERALDAQRRQREL